jgi:hypothetical protein
MIWMKRLEVSLDRLITAIARHGKLECGKCGEFYPKGLPCRCGCGRKK